MSNESFVNDGTWTHIATLKAFKYERLAPHLEKFDADIHTEQVEDMEKGTLTQLYVTQDKVWEIQALVEQYVHQPDKNKVKTERIVLFSLLFLGLFAFLLFCLEHGVFFN